jgi:hypothetical protein
MTATNRLDQIGNPLRRVALCRGFQHESAIEMINQECLPARRWPHLHTPVGNTIKPKLAAFGNLGQ